MLRCKKCVMPDTRPDHVFVDGVCPACINHDKKPDIDWGSRENELISLLDKHDGRCIVPSSGGKDSTYQVIKLLEYGADPLIVTATTCHLTEIGRKNIDNLARFATTIEISLNKEVRAKLNRLGLEMVGDISWPEHVSIFTTPFKVAEDMKIPLIFYGENPQNQYGGPQGTEEAMQMTRRWTQEFGGFLGLRPSDFIGVEGITKKHMMDYELPDEISSEAHFLGQYLPWDSNENARIAIENGLVYQKPCDANWWEVENQDNAQTLLHDYFMYLKYGYGRGCTQISVDVRNGLISREDALAWVKEKDHLLCGEYMGVSLRDILDRIGMGWDELDILFEQYRTC